MCFIGMRVVVTALAVLAFSGCAAFAQSFCDANSELCSRLFAERPNEGLITDFCKKRPDLCRGKELEPAPICEIDPCACVDCSKLAQRDPALIEFMKSFKATSSAAAREFGFGSISDSDVPRSPLDLCAVDETACEEFPDETGAPPETDLCSTLPGGCQVEHAPPPLCVIDPCSCEDCSDLRGEAQPGRFESAPEEIVADLSSTAKPTVEGILASPAPSPEFEGALAAPPPTDLPNKAPTFKLDRLSMETTGDESEKPMLACSSDKSRPNEFWRELMLNRKQMLECNDAAQIMMDQRTSERYRIYYRNVIAGRSSLKDDSSMLLAFKTYRAACIHRLSDIRRTSALTFSLGQDFIERVKKNIGSVTMPKRSVHCTGVIVRQSVNRESRISLATAAHCVGDPTKGAGKGRLQYGEVFPDLLFTTFGGEQFRVVVDGKLRGFNYDEKQDAVMLPLVEDVPVADSDLGFEIASVPSVWEPLYVVGVNPFLTALARAEADENPQLFNSASISFEPGCRVYGINGSELRHNCQTEQSMSGSPIFVSQDGTAKIVAVHSAETDQTDLAQCPQDAGALNWGTLLNP